MRLRFLLTSWRIDGIRKGARYLVRLLPRYLNMPRFFNKVVLRLLVFTVTARGLCTHIPYRLILQNRTLMNTRKPRIEVAIFQYKKILCYLQHRDGNWKRSSRLEKSVHIFME